MARRYRLYGVSLLLLQMACACSDQTPAQQPAQNSATVAEPAAGTVPAADGKFVVAFGDSLYAGYNLPPDKGFAPVLEKALGAAGVKASVFNAGVSGDTTTAGLARLAFTLDGLPRKPDLVIVGLGGNDMLRGLSPEQTRANLDAILKDLKARGLKTMLTGMVASPNMGPDYAAAFNPIFPELAKAYDVPLYPFFLDGVVGTPGLQLADGIHPNEHGIDVVVKRIEPAVAEALAAP